MGAGAEGASKASSKLPIGRICAFIMQMLWLTMPGLDVPNLLRWLYAQFDSHVVMYTVMTWGLAEAASWLGVAFFYFLYWLQNPWIESFKIQKNKVWPWFHEDKKVRDDYRKFEKKMFWQKIALEFFYALPAVYISYYLPGMNRIDWDPDTIPAWYWRAPRLTFLGLFNTFFFYWVHRLMHDLPGVTLKRNKETGSLEIVWLKGWFYETFHKMHHSLIPETVLGSSFMHPLDHLLTNWLPFHVCSVIMGVHVWEYWTYMFAGTLMGVDDHSGYNFPASPLRLFLGGHDADHHYFHHTHNVGNFVGPTWDIFFKTEDAFTAYNKKQQEKALKEEQAKAKAKAQ